MLLCFVSLGIILWQQNNIHSNDLFKGHKQHPQFLSVQVLILSAFINWFVLKDYTVKRVKCNFCNLWSGNISCDGCINLTIIIHCHSSLTCCVYITNMLHREGWADGFNVQAWQYIFCCISTICLCPRVKSM